MQSDSIQAVWDVFPGYVLLEIEKYHSPSDIKLNHAIVSKCITEEVTFAWRR